MNFLMSVGLPYILGQTSIYVYGAVEDEMNNLRVVEIIHFGNKKRPSRKKLDSRLKMLRSAAQVLSNKKIILLG